MRLLDPLTSLAPSAVATGDPGSRRIDLFFTIPELAQLGRANLWHRWWLEGSGWHPGGGWRQRGGLWASAVSATAYTGACTDMIATIEPTMQVSGIAWNTVVSWIRT